jgi:hypothetical protein
MTVSIYQVRDNLKKTIEGKEALLEEYKKASMTAVRNDTPDRITIAAMAGFLSININELKVILYDVEQCCEKATLDSWIINPERMGQ